MMIKIMHINHFNARYKQNQGQKPYDHLNRLEKAFDKIHHFFMIKQSYEEPRSRRNISQHNKGYKWLYITNL
jgi:hypothetical protein